MPISNTKKSQDFINFAGAAAQTIGSAADKLDAVRAAYIAHGVDPTGTPLEGNVALVSAWIDTVRACADSPVALGMIDAIVPTHRNKSMEE